MPYRSILALVMLAVLGIASVSDAFAYRRGGAVAWRGPAGRGHAVAWRGGGYVRPGVGAAAVGGAAVGAAAAGAYYNNRYQCGYYPYPPCY
jgi:hypothetical protein